jgi:hypothetical protein
MVANGVIAPDLGGSLGQDQQLFFLAALASPPEDLDQPGREERQACHDGDPGRLVEPVAAHEEEPSRRPESAGCGRVALGSVPLSGPKQRAPPRRSRLAEWIIRQPIHSWQSRQDIADGLDARS